MPRRRKNLGGNPFRKTTNSKEVVSSVASHEEPTTTLPSMCETKVDQEELFTSISEMFSDLDPDVVYLMLSECDFKVENAMDCLLELSATDAKIEESPSKSFVASENQVDAVGSEIMEKCPPEEESEDSKMDSFLDMQLTEDLDSLIQNAFEKLNSSPDDHAYSFLPLQDVNNFSNPSAFINSDSSSVTPILSTQNMDLNSENVESSAPILSSNSLTSHSLSNESKSFTKDNTLALEDSLLSSSLNVANDTMMDCSNQIQKELLESVCVKTQFSQAPVDLDANELQAPSNRTVQNLGLGLLGTGGDQKSSVPDVFVPSEEFNFQSHKQTELPPKGKDVNYCPVLTPLPLLLPPPPPPPLWNPMIPAFDLFQGNHGFVAPVVTTAAHWRPVNYTFPPPVISHTSPTKVWRNKEGTSAYQVQETPVSQVVRKKTSSYVGLVLVLLRGLPGSGKSFLARTLQEDNPSGVILSTDDYFYINGQYQFDVKYLGEAHEWNQNRAKEAFEKKVSPIIIDNTNLQAWEMKPYVALSQKHKYKVLFREPDTWWKFKPKELARRNIHGISKEKITRMLEHYQRFVSVPIIMSSSVPEKMERIELCAYSCDRSTSTRDNEDIASEKEENVLSSSLKHPELIEEKKHDVTKENLLPENVTYLPNADLNNGKKEISGMNPNIQNAFIQEAPDIYFSDSESKERAADKSEKEEPVEMAPEKECSKTNADSFVERISPSICYGGNNQEDCGLSNTVPLQNEKSSSSETLEERAGVKKKAFGKQKSKSTSEKFPRQELSFVGDWPVDKSIGQRTKRNRKTEKALSIQSDKKYNCPQSHKVLDSSLSVSIDCIQPQGSPHENVEDDSKSQCDDASESFNSCKYGTYKNTEKDSFNIVGDWPSSDSLAQREHRSRMPKAGLNEPNLEFGINNSMNDMSLYTAREGCWGTSPEELKTLGSSTRGSSEMLPNEMTCENKTCPSKKIHRQHTLSLTFTNSVPTAPGGVRPQTLAEFQEEKTKEVPGIEVGKCTQTEPQDFALLWKIEKNKISVSDSLRVLTGRLDGFKPKAFNINTKLDVQETIPYRVMYDKSTYVEESELTSADESENLNILCKLFGSFSLEALKDLYERCNKDIIWATSLLLDSETKLCEDTEFENIKKSYDEAQIGPFSLGLNLKEIISQRGSLEESNSSVPEFSHGIGISNTNVQSTCNLEKENLEQAEITAITTEKRGLITGIFPNVDLKNNNEVLPNSQAELSGLYNVKQFFPGTLKATATKNVSEMEKNPEVTEIGDSIHSSLNLSDILNSVSSTSDLELHEEIYFTDSFDINKSENLPKDYVKFPNTEEFMNEDEREVEKILMAGSALSAGVTEEDKTETLNPTPVMAKSLTIDCLELALPPELAFQLNELFGPVGIDSGSLTVEDCVVHIDLNLAKVIHEKWKESVMERQRQEEVSCGKLMQDPSLVGRVGLDNPEQKSSQRMGKKLLKTLAAPEMLPLLDHWNTHTKKVSLREIMSEEIALQEKHDLKREPLIIEKDCATKLKEKQLFKIFPAINQNFLVDIFKDHNYSLEHTVQFLNCVLEGDPVKTVVAQEFVHQNENVTSHTAQKSKEKKAKKLKETEDIPSEPSFQDFEYPEYDDYRAEAFLHQQKRMECYSKAKEAYRLGKKNVATFYAQQGSLHEQKMKEANHLAAVEIFEKVNASLLPQNVLDLHGLHVDEAIEHLMTVLQQKTEEFKQNGGKPYLSVITGRGNHSQGGVARIKPAVIKYLTSHSFRFSEIKPGCLKVMLK
ncbi:NEDD4-binding protein 2 isoform X1 [Physeter macrocephalus]|uniref:NEDD4-binding protein 2 isoform X1 n=2 Tax=Physeter macrocephalus TaxID=9755 RepID=A0A2Y9TGJ3_PHYMC|nr:NEDD4-binding protein 2 isoform X1 [Physeter catodon]XP_028347835.1 NEDD4-binding protein 2 isoform X1 [Physeter catodon]XP_028347839.1 NEDD4-binding protein 2 isoform X1 [Physeter catodon]XP_054942052.1 NEDD4-binding protein 2 isoform X1 [Physeter catodon]XP_054942053.1 NEDD4-binding protein 2 isoform X1 [Physeter catodon]XP_054942054.1 NEDD4-binding protein 2 isoform X1 [Physeter catodon]XP_054942055.1 NEDD4-binding protein 2 isoform X1 [Physeter catodon]XP_054942056.1 NEDD4-binding pro|eukprot:XP_007129301.2 NEDD4-binding protein 2 isoform X1 [Physeter catodon]